MATIEAEMINEAGVLTRDESTPVARNGNYEPVRFNAMKHGILSRLAVLAHEDQAEFTVLLAALIEEHRPAGMTERHLTEELAATIWRKRRVLLAEDAKINEGLKSAVNSPKLVMPSAAPFQRGLTGENADLRKMFDATPNEIAERQRDAELDLAATQMAAAILRKGGPNCYERARRTLIPESRDWWDEHVEEEKHPATAEGLAKFIHDRWNRAATAWRRKPNLPRQSRRKPWAKGCKRTDWAGESAAC